MPDPMREVVVTPEAVVSWHLVRLTRHVGKFVEDRTAVRLTVDGRTFESVGGLGPGEFVDVLTDEVVWIKFQVPGWDGEKGASGGR